MVIYADKQMCVQKVLFVVFVLLFSEPNHNQEIFWNNGLSELKGLHQ